MEIVGYYVVKVSEAMEVERGNQYQKEHEHGHGHGHGHGHENEHENS